MGIWSSKRHHLHERIDEEKKVILEENAERKLRKVFARYASVVKNGTPYMTAEDFVVKFLQLLNGNDYNRETATFFFGVVDREKLGLISYQQFKEFESILRRPDCFYRTIFRLFDRNGVGKIHYDDFESVMRRTALHATIPYDKQLRLLDFYFGKNRQEFVRYEDFNQMLVTYYREVAVTAFLEADHLKNGTISADDFYKILISTKGHLFTHEIIQRLTEIADKEDNCVKYSNFIAIYYLLSNMEMVKRIYLLVTEGNKEEFVTEDEFMHSAQLMSPMTPLEVNMLFQLCLVTRSAPIYDRSSEMAGIETDESITYDDIKYIAPEQHYAEIAKKLYSQRRLILDRNRNFWEHLSYSFGVFKLGMLAGALGASVVYPLDLIKTRQQLHEKHCLSGLQCFRHIVKHEGYMGLYKGAIVNIILVGPQKAITLTSNEFVRDQFYNDKDRVPFYGDVIAGAVTGFIQVCFSCPLEVVKVYFQTHAMKTRERLRYKQVYRNYGGLFGLYKGFTSYLLRDVPFNAMYFSIYYWLKEMTKDKYGENSAWSLLCAGGIAGIPTAIFVTPFDVIKARLPPNEPMISTTSIWKMTRKIYQSEGFKPFTKGFFSRVLKNSPQLGITLFAFEKLEHFYYEEMGRKRRKRRAELKQTPPNPDHVGGYSVANLTFDAIEKKFGLLFPKKQTD